MTKSFQHPLFATATALVVCACGGETLSTAKYAGTLGAEDAKNWQQLLPGNKLAIYAPAGSCQVEVAASFGDIDGGKTQPLAGSPLGAKLSVVDIVDSKVKTGGGGYAALQVKLADASTQWLKLPAGSSQGCLQPVPAELDKAQALVGKRVVFTPWVPGCHEVEAAGRSPQAMLVDAEGELAMQAEGLALGPASAQAFAEGKSGNRVWVVLANGALDVRSDVLASCFSAPGSASAKHPDGPLALLRTPEGRCDKDEDAGQAHLACKTSLAVWTGVATDKAIDLRVARHTLGEVNFLGGRLVDGARYASTVVAITMGNAQDDRQRRLYAALQGSIQNALSRDASGVRIAPDNAPEVTYRVRVEAGQVQIGDVQTSESQQTSHYKVRDDIKPNPDKPAAQDRVNNARDKLTQAKQDFQDRKREFDQEKKKVIDECNEKASQASGWGAVAAGAGCAAADAVIQPSDSDVVAAQKELDDAESTLSNMPDTITVPVMADWPYTKKEYSRVAQGSLVVKMQANGWPQARVETTQLNTTWRDYEVAADAAHGVDGHQPERGPLDSPEALVPFIAKAASDQVAKTVHVAISEAVVERARAALAASGHEATKPGFEIVDAMAYQMAGNRLQKPLLRGNTTLTGKASVALPTEALSVGPNECIAAAAVAAPGVPGTVTLESKDGLFADTRGTGFAIIEICGSEISGGKLPDVELGGQANGEVRWTIYRTSPTSEGK